MRLFLCFIIVSILCSCGKEPSTANNDYVPPTGSKNTVKEVEGEKLFKVKCAACHAVNKKIIGPPLAGSMERWDNNKEDLYLYVRNWKEANEKGIKRAVEVEDYDPSMMNFFPELTDKELDQLFAYVEEMTESSN